MSNSFVLRKDKKHMKCALITGASSGIGAEFVKQCAESGEFDKIIVIARRAERLQELASLYGEIIEPLVLDLSKEESFEQIKDKLAGEDLKLSLVVAAAGLGKYGSFPVLSQKNCETMVNLNVLGLIRTVRATLDSIISGGRIILMGSQSSFQPLPHFNIYASTKAFVVHFGRALNIELKNRKISVTTVCPGYVESEFFTVAAQSEDPDACTNFNPMYKACDVVKRALKDSKKGKDMSVYGANVKFMRLLCKLLPHSLVMKVWLKIK